MRISSLARKAKFTKPVRRHSSKIPRPLQRAKGRVSSKQRFRFTWFCLLAATCAPAVAEPRSLSVSRAPTARSIEVRRYELSVHRTFPVAKGAPLMANRVYLVNDPKVGQWVFEMTNPSGYLPSPAECLSPGSVLEGSALGGDANKRYELTKRSTWKESQQTPRTFLWIALPMPDYRLRIPDFEENIPRQTSSK